MRYLLVLLGILIASSAWADYQRTPFSHLTSEVWRYQGTFTRNDLVPVANNNPFPEPQPDRARPRNATLSADGKTLYITLQGTEQAPEHHIAVLDVESNEVRERIEVGSRPYGIVNHPRGRYMAVTNEFSNYISVIDTTSNTVCGEIPFDYYAQGMVFSKDGSTAWVANRYLNQVLMLEITDTGSCLSGRVKVVGGFSDIDFFGSNEPPEPIKEAFSRRKYKLNPTDTYGGVNAILRARCQKCHTQSAGGFIAGDDPKANFLSAVETSVGGFPYESPLLKAVLPKAMGGFGDERTSARFHPGGVLFEEGEADLEQVVRWIRNGEGGPGIMVGNEGSHPKDLVLSNDGRYLFVGNTGTLDVSVIDTTINREVGAIYTQNTTSHLSMTEDGSLIILTLGAGFGAPKEHDPLGGETWDRRNPAAQFSVLRDPLTTDAYPLEKQHVLGPYDAIDGTWNFKMRDIQNDIIAIDVNNLDIPEWEQGKPLDYILKTNHYESHRNWVRYTSDTAETTSGDIKGDIPPELQRVVGAYPSWSKAHGDRLYTVMSGSFEVVEWQVNVEALDPSEWLTPIRVFETGLRPMGLELGTIGPARNKLFAVNNMGESVSVIDLKDGSHIEIAVGDLARPPLDTDAEKGDLIAHTTIFSSDGDTSCVHCHIRDTGDGRGWGAAETIGQTRNLDFTPGGTLGIPQIRNIYAIQPFYFEGTHMLGEGQGADINEPVSSIDFDRPIWAGDFTQINSPIPSSKRRLMHEELKERVSSARLGKQWYDLEERRAQFLRQQSMRYFGVASNLEDMYRYMGTWMGNQNRLIPQPYDKKNPSVERGRALFNSPQVMCSICHTEPEFTNKTDALTHNDRRALPQLTTMTRRDASYTLTSVRAVDTANEREFDYGPNDKGRVEEVEGSFTTMQLRGIFDRPPVFLHHGRARSLREVVLTPDHLASRTYRYPVLLGDEVARAGRKEIGFNELTARHNDGRLNPSNQIFDTHGGTSHLTPRQIEDLVNFMRTIE